MNGRSVRPILGSILVACAAAWAAGEVWRTPERFPKATGPSSVQLAPTGKSKKGRAVRLEVSAVDAAKRPVDGLAVAVLGVFGKKDKLERAATDAQGRVVVDGKGLTGLAVGFTWDGGAKAIKARLEPDKSGWRIAEAPYKRIIDGQDDGSCKNLFTLSGTGAADSYRLELRVPESLLECEEVAYGAERKVGEIVRVAAIGERDVNVGDKNAFTADDERKIGLEASTRFDQQFQKIDDPQIVGYVQRLMEKIVAASDVPKMPIHLRVVHTNDVNAFVTAGGHVYVFTGLIAMAQNESQLAGVLAHEGSHAVARHVTEGATRGSKAQTGAALGSAALGALLGANESGQQLIEQGAGTVAGLVTMRYDRRSETEADLLGSQYLWNAGWDPEAIARFFELLGSQSSGSGAPPAWMSTHPPHERRVENGIQWARAFLPPRDRYLVDTAEFQAVRAKVRKLPAPKPASVPPEGQKSLVQFMTESETWKKALAAPSE
jgi:Zn-dependent protease with chaperone function